MFLLLCDIFLHSLILPILSLDIILQPHAGLHLSPSSLAMSFRGFGSSFLESALFQDFMFNVTKRSKHSRHMSKFLSDDDTVKRITFLGWCYYSITFDFQIYRLRCLWHGDPRPMSSGRHEHHLEIPGCGEIVVNHPCLGLKKICFKILNPDFLKIDTVLM